MKIIKIKALFYISIIALISIGTSAQAQYFDATRWEGDISAFEEQDRISMPAEGGILFTGSSSIRFWHDRLAQDMAGLTVIPRGYGGSTMQDSVFYIERLVHVYKPRAIVLYQGDNDVGAYGVAPSQVRDLFELFTAQVHEKLPDTRIYMLAIKPSILREAVWPQMQEANALLEEVTAKDERLFFIDIVSPMLKSNGKIKR